MLNKWLFTKRWISFIFFFFYIIAIHKGSNTDLLEERWAGAVFVLRAGVSLYHICEWKEVLSSLHMMLCLPSVTLKSPFLTFWFWPVNFPLWRPVSCRHWKHLQMVASILLLLLSSTVPFDHPCPRAACWLSVRINHNLCSTTAASRCRAKARRLGLARWSAHSLLLCKPVVSYLSCQRVLPNPDIVLQMSDRRRYHFISTTVSAHTGVWHKEAVCRVTHS